MELTEPERKTIGRGFSPAYGRLVASEHDVVGMVAYGAYKAHKRAAVVEQRCHRDARWFYDWNQHVASTPARLYQNLAEARLQAFADTVAEGAYEQGRADARRKPAARSDVKRNYWVGVASSATATFVVGVLTLFAIAQTTQVDPVTAILHAVATAHPAYQIQPAAGPVDTPQLVP